MEVIRYGTKGEYLFECVECHSIFRMYRNEYDEIIKNNRKFICPACGNKIYLGHSTWEITRGENRGEYIRVR